MLNKCFICKKECTNCNILTNGVLFHKDCYYKLINDNNNISQEINEYKKEILRLEVLLKKELSLKSKLNNLFFGFKSNVKYFQKSIEDFKNKVHELELMVDNQTYRNNSSQKLKDITLKYLYDYWPNYPPDWLDRKDNILAKKDYCNMCGYSPIDKSKLHIHHSIPLSKGGSNKFDNLVVLCWKCHEKIHGFRKFNYKDDSMIGNNMFIRDSFFTKRVNKIQQAIINKNYLHFKYEKFSGKKSVRSILPKNIEKVGKSLCITGFCYLRNDERTFSIKRMSYVKVLNKLQ